MDPGAAPFLVGGTPCRSRKRDRYESCKRDRYESCKRDRYESRKRDRYESCKCDRYGFSTAQVRPLRSPDVRA